jgi:hypothetical protein
VPQGWNEGLKAGGGGFGGGETEYEDVDRLFRDLLGRVLRVSVEKRAMCFEILEHEFCT